MNNNALSTNNHSSMTNPASKPNGLRYREATKRPVAVETPTAYIMPMAVPLTQIPGGFYYPVQDRNSGDFALKRVASPKRQMGLVPSSADRDMMDFGAEKIFNHIAHIDTTNSLDEAKLSSMETATRTQRERYFPLEDYHPGLKMARENIRRFAENEDAYLSRGLNYKRSVLLFGDPGTGKSRMLYEACNDMIASHDAVVIKIDTDSDMDTLFDSGIIPISQLLGDRMKIILIEELSQLCGGYRDLVKLLHLLDSFILNENVLFLMSTNYPDRIPSNVIDRPSRVDYLAKVNCKDFDTAMVAPWYKHLMERDLQPTAADQAWINAKLSPAYLKELFMFAEINSCSLAESWDVILERRELIEKNFAESERRVGF